MAGNIGITMQFFDGSKKVDKKVLKDKYLNKWNNACAASILKKINNDYKDTVIGTVTVPLTGLSQPRRKNEASLSPYDQAELARKRIAMAYHLVSIIFYKVVARTPVDEEYDYFVKSKNVKKFDSIDDEYYKDNSLPRRKNESDTAYLDRITKKKSQLDIFLHTNGYSVKHHKPDDEVLRDTWYLELDNGVKICSKDLGIDWDVAYLSFADNIDNKYWKVIQSALGYKETRGFLKKENKPFTSYKIYNTNERWKLLEFGLYKKKDSINQRKEGKNRYHGVTDNGFSVQAPRGMFGLTIAEIDQLERESKENLFASSYGYTVKDISLNNYTKFGDRKHKHRKDYEAEVKSRKAKFIFSLESKVLQEEMKKPGVKDFSLEAVPETFSGGKRANSAREEKERRIEREKRHNRYLKSKSLESVKKNKSGKNSGVDEISSEEKAIVNTNELKGVLGDEQVNSKLLTQEEIKGLSVNGLTDTNPEEQMYVDLYDTLAADCYEFRIIKGVLQFYDIYDGKWKHPMEVKNEIGGREFVKGNQTAILKAVRKVMKEGK